MIAELGMYDWPEERDALDRLWQAMARRLPGAPAGLNRAPRRAPPWEDPALFLGQTCGLPYRTRLHGRVALLGAFDFALPDAPPGHYYSEIVVNAARPGDSLAAFEGETLALNAFDSQSGWAAIATLAAREGVRFGDWIATGAHAESARAVAEERAGIAAIDAVSWRLLRRHRPETAARLRVLARTEPTPGLPLITATRRDAAAIAAAMAHALATPPDTGALGVAGFVPLPPAAYLAVPAPPVPADILRAAVPVALRPE